MLKKIEGGSSLPQLIASKSFGEATMILVGSNPRDKQNLKTNGKKFYNVFQVYFKIALVLTSKTSGKTLWIGVDMGVTM